MGWMDQRLILADAQGVVIADSEQALLGSQLSSDEIASGSPVSVQNLVVGTLIVVPANLQSVTNPASTFLVSVNRSILISVVVAGDISLVLVMLFSIQITAPIRQMQKAAGAITKGDLNQRVPVRLKDELGRLAETFNQMTGSLARAETQRQKLLADVAHELRTPLAVIQANTEGMQDGVLPLDLEQINAIYAETLLLGRLINDLRLISVAETGELRLERRVMDLDAMLESTAERFRSQAAQKEVVLSIAIEPRLPQVSVDSDRITQVLNNLLSNALRYTPECGTITIQASATAENTSEVYVSITDTGSGIPKDDLPWVFDCFYRADRSRARVSGGTGLGLAIVKQLVEAHCGRVWADSPVFGERGTRIMFSLPIAQK